jgi:hypothetical protein
MKGIIAVVDALGVSTYSLEQSEYFVKARDGIISRITRISEDHSERLAGESLIPIINTIGDTIVFSWRTAEDKPNFLRGAVWTGTWLRYLTVLGLHNGLLFRGAMAYGDFISAENTILGPAVADAVSWYESADWFGIICAPSMQFLFNAADILEGKESQMSWFIKYNVPMKNSPSKSLWTIPWPYDIWADEHEKSKGKAEVVRDSKARINILLEGMKVPKGTEDKYLNSLAYFDYCVNAFNECDKPINDASLYTTLTALSLELKV